MKRKFLFVLTSVFFLAVTPFVSASELNGYDMAVEQELTFTGIEVSEAPSAVLEAVKEDFPGAEIVKVFVADVSGEKVYKIVVKDSEGNKDSGLYNSDGVNYAPEA